MGRVGEGEGDCSQETYCCQRIKRLKPNGLNEFIVCLEVLSGDGIGGKWYLSQAGPNQGSQPGQLHKPNCLVGDPNRILENFPVIFFQI